MSAPGSLLAEVLPRFDASEVHDVWVPARPEVVFAAVKEVTVREVRLLMPLMAVRGLPRLLARRPGFRPAWSARALDAFLEVGFVPLGERPGGDRSWSRRPLLAPGRKRAGSGAHARGLRRVRRAWGMRKRQ